MRRRIRGSDSSPGRLLQAPGGFFFALATISSLLSCADPLPDRATEGGPLFVDVADDAGLHRPHVGGTAEKGYIVEAKGGGVAVLDAEGDGDLDLYWVNGATLEDPLGAGNALYRNDGKEGFRDVAASAGVVGRGWGMGALAADFDNDGDSDLHVTCLTHNLLFRNDSGRFAEWGSRAGVDLPLWSTGAAAGDYDLDGDLDLYVANYVDFDPDSVAHLGTRWKGVPAFIGPLGLRALPDCLYRNEGDRFTDVSAPSGVTGVDPGYGLGVLFADLDVDGDADLYVANDSSPNFLFSNDSRGRFSEAGLGARASHGAMGNAQAGMGVAAGDFDGDGLPDLLVTNFDDDYNTLYQNRGGATFEDVSFAAGLGREGLPFVGFGAAFLDYDRDADLDLFVANGHVYPQIDTSGTNSTYAQADHLFANVSGRFERVLHDGSDPFGPPRVSRGAAALDFDDDGDLDLFVAHLDDRPALYRNDAAGGNWLGLRLVGVRSNREGIGARVAVHAGGQRQVRESRRGSSFLGSEDPRLHFGLGGAALVDSLTVHWPGGGVQVLTAVPPNQYLVVTQAASASR